VYLFSDLKGRCGAVDTATGALCHCCWSTVSTMKSYLYDTKYQTVQVISVKPCNLLNRYQNILPLLSGYKRFACWRTEIDWLTGNFNTVNILTGLQYTSVEFVNLWVLWKLEFLLPVGRMSATWRRLNVDGFVLILSLQLRLALQVELSEIFLNRIFLPSSSFQRPNYKTSP